MFETGVVRVLDRAVAVQSAMSLESLEVDRSGDSLVCTSLNHQQGLVNSPTAGSATYLLPLICCRRVEPRVVLPHVIDAE